MVRCMNDIVFMPKSSHIYKRLTVIGKTEVDLKEDALYTWCIDITLWIYVISKLQFSGWGTFSEFITYLSV